MEGNDCLLPLFGYDADLDIALLNVEHGIRWIPLREDDLVLLIVRYSPAPVHGGEKRFDVEGRLPLSLHANFPSIIGLKGVAHSQTPRRDGRIG